MGISKIFTRRKVGDLTHTDYLFIRPVVLGGVVVFEGHPGILAILEAVRRTKYGPDLTISFVHPDDSFTGWAGFHRVDKDGKRYYYSLDFTVENYKDLWKLRHTFDSLAAPPDPSRPDVPGWGGGMALGVSPADLHLHMDSRHLPPFSESGFIAIETVKAGGWVKKGTKAFADAYRTKVIPQYGTYTETVSPVSIAEDFSPLFHGPSVGFGWGLAAGLGLAAAASVAWHVYGPGYIKAVPLIVDAARTRKKLFRLKKKAG
jgi:hypothetical protein